MTLEVIVTGPAKVNSYIAANEQLDCIIVDPGADPGELIKTVSRRGLQVCGYLLTHGHIDHVAGLAEIFKRFPASCWLHSADMKMLKSGQFRVNGYPALRDLESDVIFSAFPPDGVLLKYPFHIEAIHLPGHSPGSVCYLLKNELVMFCGDTVFSGFCADTTTLGSNASELGSSLDYLMDMPEDIILYPGHGRSTTIGAEKRGNYHILRLKKIKEKLSLLEEV